MPDFLVPRDCRPSRSGRLALPALWWALAVGALAQEADLGVEKEPRLAGKVVVVAVEDETLNDSRQLSRLAALLEEAAAALAEAVVFDIRVGGDHSAEVFRQVLDLGGAGDVVTVAYVNPTALSAGAALALTRDQIFFAPSGVLGAASPVPPETGDEAAVAAYDRRVSVIAAQLKARAEALGHPVRLVGALADPSVGLEGADGEVVKAVGRPLALAAGEATASFAGLPALAAGVVSDLDALVAEAGFAGEVVSVDPAVAQEDWVPGPPVVDVVEEEAAGGPDGAPAADGARAAEGAGRREGEPSYAGKVVVIPIGEDDLMAKARFDFMKRSLARADAEGARAVVFDLNTPGGYAWYTAQLMMQELAAADVPTISYVNPAAVSAGSLIAIATDRIYMAPASTIGAAAVVTATGADLNETMAQKMNSTIISIARNVAELHGHNPDIAEAFIDPAKRVVVGGVEISEGGKLLSLNATTATEVIGGRPLLAEGIARDLEDLLEQEGLAGGEVVRAEPLGMEAFAHWVQKISVFLILLGMAGAYIEIQQPGFGIPGAVALLAFGLFFFGNHLAGKLAGYELFVLFALGVLLVLVEFVLFPGTLVAGIVGFGLMLGSLFFAMFDRLDLEALREGGSLAPGWIEVATGPAITLALGVAGGLALILAAMAFLPRTRFMGPMVLREAIPAGTGALSPGGHGTAGTSPPSRVGDDGVAVTDLRPSGRIRLGGELLEATADATFLREGTRVRVVEDSPGRLVVEEV